MLFDFLINEFISINATNFIFQKKKKHFKSTENIDRRKREPSLHLTNSRFENYKSFVLRYQKNNLDCEIHFAIVYAVSAQWLYLSGARGNWEIFLMKILIKTVWKMSESVPRKLEMQLIRRVPSRRCHIAFFRNVKWVRKFAHLKSAIKTVGVVFALW